MANIAYQYSIQHSLDMYNYAFSDLKLSKDGLMKRLLSSAKPGTGMVIAVKKLNHESFQGHKEWLVRELHQIIKIFCFLINGCLE